MPQQQEQSQSKEQPTAKASSYPNIKEVFGRDDYNLRAAIAQTLYKKGESLFPGENTPEHLRKEQSVGATLTSYTGKSSENVALAKLTAPKLREIKKDVLACDADFPKCMMPDKPVAK